MHRHPLCIYETIIRFLLQHCMLAETVTFSVYLIVLYQKSRLDFARS